MKCVKSDFGAGMKNKEQSTMNSQQQGRLAPSFALVSFGRASSWLPSYSASWRIRTGREYSIFTMLE